jgi:hypothetical protein
VDLLKTKKAKLDESRKKYPQNSERANYSGAPVPIIRCLLIEIFFMYDLHFLSLIAHFGFHPT